MFIYEIILDNPDGVQSSLADVEARVNEVDSLLASVDTSSATYSSLTNIKALMESLASAFASYLAVLSSTNSSGGRVKRALGKYFGSIAKLKFKFNIDEFIIKGAHQRSCEIFF